MVTINPFPLSISTAIFRGISTQDDLVIDLIQYIFHGFLSCILFLVYSAWCIKFARYNPENVSVNESFDDSNEQCFSNLWNRSGPRIFYSIPLFMLVKCLLNSLRVILISINKVGPIYSIVSYFISAVFFDMASLVVIARLKFLARHVVE